MELQIENLHKQAVDAAITSNWSKSIELNKKIVTMNPEYLDAYLGLGFAHMQLNKFKEAKKYYQEATKIDPNNVIARNNIEKLSILSKSGSKASNDLSVDPNIFMNVRGKTKVVTLLNVGKPDVLVKLSVGEKVSLRLKKRRLEVRNEQDEYVGAIPDDISKRLIFFLEGKSQFNTYVKATTKNTVDVFIREEKKGRKVKNFISFPENMQDDFKLMASISADDEQNHSNDENSDDSDSSPSEEDQDEDNSNDYDSLEEFDRNDKEEDTYFSELKEDDDDDEFDD